MSQEPLPLRTTHCSECGYCLTGLPERGRCPECGFEYTPDKLVLHGWAFGKRADVSTARKLNPFTFLWLVGVLLFVYYDSGGRSRPRSLYIWGAITIVLVGHQLYRRWNFAQQKMKPLQLHLNADGFGLRMALASKWDLHPWSHAEEIEIKPAGQDLWRLRIGQLKKKSKNFQLQLSSPSLVEFEFEADPATAAQIRLHIEELRQRAATAEAGSTTPPTGMPAPHTTQ
jgi:hypothetical protein